GRLEGHAAPHARSHGLSMCHWRFWPATWALPPRLLLACAALAACLQGGLRLLSSSRAPPRPALSEPALPPSAARGSGAPGAPSGTVTAAAPPPPSAPEPGAPPGPEARHAQPPPPPSAALPAAGGSRAPGAPLGPEGLAEGLPAAAAEVAVPAPPPPSAALPAAGGSRAPGAPLGPEGLAEGLPAAAAEVAVPAPPPPSAALPAAGGSRAPGAPLGPEGLADGLPAAAAEVAVPASPPSSAALPAAGGSRAPGAPLGPEGLADGLPAAAAEEVAVPAPPPSSAAPPGALSGPDAGRVQPPPAGAKPVEVSVAPGAPRSPDGQPREPPRLPYHADEGLLPLPDGVLDAALARTPGDRTGVREVLAKLQANGSVKVQVLGGSLTLGGQDCRQERLGATYLSRDCAWPARLQRRLRAGYPGAAVTVENRAIGGCGTACILPQLSLLEAGDYTAPDLFIIDLAVNDVRFAMDEAFAGSFEALIRMIGTFVDFGRILLLQTVPFHEASITWREDKDVMMRAFENQQQKYDKLARQYHIPIVSCFDATREFASMLNGTQEFWVPGRKWEHPQWKTHAYIADLIVHLLNSQVGPASRMAPAAREWHRPASLLGDAADASAFPLLHKETALVLGSLCQKPLSAHRAAADSGSRPRLTAGWSLREDRPGKPGWIAEASAPEFTIPIPLDEPPAKRSLRLKVGDNKTGIAGIVIEHVRGGIFDEWNRGNPLQHCEQGDIIVAINGVRSDPEKMLRGLQNKPVNITCRKNPRRKQPQSHWIEFPVSFGAAPILSVSVLRSYEGLGEADVQMNGSMYMLRGLWQLHESQTFAYSFIANHSYPHVHQTKETDCSGREGRKPCGFGISPYSTHNVSFRLATGPKFKIISVISC
ncbi:unnamed protein product, partial [Prorocentrum cordatum]